VLLCPIADQVIAAERPGLEAAGGDPAQGCAIVLCFAHDNRPGESWKAADRVYHHPAGLTTRQP